VARRPFGFSNKLGRETTQVNSVIDRVFAAGLDSNEVPETASVLRD